MTDPACLSDESTRERGCGARCVRAAIALTAVALLAGGCAESRRSSYEQMLRGEVVRVSVDDQRFASAFPETGMPRFADARVD